MILEVSSDGYWTFCFRLSQFHGRGSWLVCEVALIPTNHVLSLQIFKDKLTTAKKQSTYHIILWYFSVTYYVEFLQCSNFHG